MTQFRRILLQLPFSYSACQRLTLSLLFGSLLGSLWAGIALKRFGCPDIAFLFYSFGSASLLLQLLQCLLLPGLLLAALLLERRWIFCLLFFCKGALTACVLCFCFSNGLPILQILFWAACRMFLPLPALIFAGSVWMGSLSECRGTLWLFVPVAVFSFLGLFLQALLY